MSKIFPYFAAGLLLLLLTASGLGIGFAMWPDGASKQTIFIAHFFIGLTTAIAILFVHCIVFIYFLGTGRWVKEVAIAYQIPDEPYPKKTRELKRVAYPAALFSMLSGIAAAAAGAGAQLQAWPWYIHLALAVLTMAINIWAFSVEYDCVAQNSGIIDAVMVEVDRIRKERGLLSNEEALREEAGVGPATTPANPLSTQVTKL